MLVYGDHSRRVSPQAVIEDVGSTLSRVAAMAPGIERHSELVAAFIEMGEVAQGIADAEFEARGCDARSPAQDAAMAALLAMAEAIRRSWDSGFADAEPVPQDTLQVLSRMQLAQSLALKQPEGYAFYAVYPESYLQAASALSGLSPVRAIGIRSIGTGLAALVAVAAGPSQPVTVRPTGDPFRRTIRLSEDLAAELVSDPASRFAIIDEGPGFSGSSFGAVADFLEEKGVPSGQVHFFPSHANDLGPEANARHRERWRRAQRHVVDFDKLVLRATNPAHLLENWVSDLIGTPDGPLQDISGGAWRSRRFVQETEWPPSHIQQERRKFLMRAGGETWLLKFVGLGREGARKLELAQRLHQGGFVPEPASYRHGFLVEHWIEKARPLSRDGGNRAALVERLAAYIGFRARAFPAEQGASLAQLLAMARRNIGLGLSEDLARRVDEWEPDLASLARQVHPIRTDNRMHAWEWLRTPDDRLIKTDALDHHVGHDLVGCQDMTWDIAGANIEFGLSDREKAELCRGVERLTRRRVDPRLLAFSELCYAAFQLGHWTLAADALVGFPAEAARTRKATAVYARTLERLLLQHEAQ
jgi:hypothetical protein